ncbi:rod shape-determining protein MreC [Flavobacterium aquatile]|uniref:Cell shape-determining protein MreC n=1 Tax=Flavobacterium aquatile LMG 4008 = ATCC 11947 TaxID=1453498 RepID=A0A095UZB5_9FLAO|nr:rod shape-determining protein MreC [Flavobacterium aquatile]KGD67935.1 rod shape-determining protein MreC [Flavobacterium aquatile LMG 4008 = ATCC 11947]OXA65389.1 rod shape-determining protein MreC [Flavobacterium aquatile LMG 4008 = ATCC 11947]
MQQIFNFIFKNSYRMLFLLLMGIALSLTIQSHSFHKSKVISSANFLSGGVYEKMNNVEEYFNLKIQNDELAKENARLKSIIFNVKDSTKIQFDTVAGNSKVSLITAKVIKNSYNVHENYLTLNRGSKEGIKQDMGVINSLGIVGVIENTSTNYSTVLSILNVKSPINAKIKKSNHIGSLTWNGKNTGFVQLVDVPRLSSARKGDTIVTGGQSTIFPENINIGTIDKVYIDNETNYYTLDIRLFNDMTSLGYVYVVKNKDTPEIIELEKITKKDE